MENKDYILRMIERMGRFLTVIMGLRKQDKDEEALIYINDVMQQTVGLSSNFINSLSDEMLLQMLSPLGALHVDNALWIAGLLNAEGDIYTDKGDGNGSYYRYLKALTLLLEVLRQEPGIEDTDFFATIHGLLVKLEPFELPPATKLRLFAYYEQLGRYAQAEDVLYERLEASDTMQADRQKFLEAGQAFYARLLRKSDADLQQGNFSREEAEEGLAQLGYAEP